MFLKSHTPPTRRTQPPHSAVSTQSYDPSNRPETSAGGDSSGSSLSETLGRVRIRDE